MFPLLESGSLYKRQWDNNKTFKLLPEQIRKTKEMWCKYNP